MDVEYFVGFLFLFIQKAKFHQKAFCLLIPTKSKMSFKMPLVFVWFVLCFYLFVKAFIFVTGTGKLEIFRKYTWFLFVFFKIVFFPSTEFTKFRQILWTTSEIPPNSKFQRKSSVVLTNIWIPAEFWRNHGMNALGPEEIIARFMHVGASGLKTHDGARRCMQDSWWGQRMHARPPCEARDPTALFMQGARAACNTGGPRLYVYMYMIIDYLRHEHQTWTSTASDMSIIHTHTSDMNIRHEHRTSDMNVNIIHEHRTSYMNIEQRTSALHVHHTWTSNIRHEHRTSDKCACMSVLNRAGSCMQSACTLMHACMHNHECMHTHGWSGHCPCMRTYAFMHSDPMDEFLGASWNCIHN